MRVGRRFALVAAVLLPATLGPARAGAVDRELTVFAAASLREALGAVATAFERAHPGVRVRLSLAGSQELRTQIEHGARADVFASADLPHMAALEKAGLVEPPAVFARNEPVVVVPRDDPAGVRAFADLPRARRIVLGAPEVPIGRYAEDVLARAAGTLGAAFRDGVHAHVVSRELNVRQVLAKVALGEADAGIVYRTDAATARDRVQVVAIPPEFVVVAQYPVAVLRGGRERDLARRFVALLLSRDGQAPLAAAGFLPAAPRP